MNNWIYTIWFRDNNASKVEEDYEWPACIIIEADSSNKAEEWGNKLAFNYCESNNNLTFLKSSVEKFDKQQYKVADDLPVIRYGYLASDSEIGW